MEREQKITNTPQAGSLEDYLALSRSLGEFESEAEFTVEVRHAFESLKKFTLADPGNYLRYLVASAVARKATRVEISTSARTLVVKDNGNSLKLEQAEILFASLLNSPTRDNVALRYLAVGLWGARNWGATSAEVSHPTFLLRLNQDEIALESTSPSEPSWNRITITEHKSVGSMLTALVSKLGWQHASGALHCLRFAPADITLNGKSIRERHPALNDPVLKIEPTPHPLPHRGRLALTLNSGHPLSLVVHGIAYEIQLPVSGIVYCNALNADASFQRLVKSRQLHELLKSLPTRLREGVFLLLTDASNALEVCRLALEYLQSNESEEFRAELLERAVLESLNGPVELRTLLQHHLDNACLLLDQKLQQYLPLLTNLFYPVAIPSDNLTTPVQELLTTPAHAVAVAEVGTHCIRFRLDSEAPFSALFFDDAEAYLAPPDGPNGFQIVCLKSGTAMALACLKLDDQIYHLGLRLLSRLHLGETTLDKTSRFFTNALHWLHQKDQMDNRFSAWLRYVRLRRESGRVVTLTELSEGWELLYRHPDDEPSEEFDCLILDQQEIELLEWNHIVLTHAHHTAAERLPMRRIEIELSTAEVNEPGALSALRRHRGPHEEVRETSHESGE